MSIKTVVCCDKCGSMIEESSNGTVNGLAVAGNIHVVSVKNDEGVGGGLVGNNLTTIDSKNQSDPIKWIVGDGFADKAVVKRVSYYCKPCFLEVVFGDSKNREDDAIIKPLRQNVIYPPGTR